MSDRPLSVLQVNTVDVFGGAARVAGDLHRAYLGRGIDSWMAVGTKQGNDPRVVEIPNQSTRSSWTRSLNALGSRPGADDSPRGLSWLASRAALIAADPARTWRISRGLEDFSYPGTARLLDLTPSPPHVLHLHNLHGFYFDIRMLPQLTRRAPAILTMHDAWALTGHCAHPFECDHWTRGCGSCPDFDLYVPIRTDGSAINCRTKRDALARSTIALATPSRWLMDLVERSGLAQKSLGARVIPNGVDTRVFRPGDRAAARDALGLPSDRPIALIAAQSLRRNPFKDFATLSAALPLIAERVGAPMTLVAIGHEEEPMSPGTAGVIEVPFVADPSRMALYYQAADVYLHVSRAENLPLAIMEAMACGAPVVASHVGGVPEIVVDGDTGLLVKPGDSGALASMAASLLGDEARRRAFSEAGVRRVRECFTLKAQADAYLEWYEEILCETGR